MADLKPTRVLFQVVNYTLFMALVWFLSMRPSFRQLADDQAVVTLAFGHAAKVVLECKRLSAEDLAKLAPNMRKATDCPRERSPVAVELSLDGKVVIKDSLEAPGLYQDQGVDYYRNIRVSAGSHTLSVWMNDDVNVDGPTYRYEQSISLRPAQRLVVSFDATDKGFSAN